MKKLFTLLVAVLVTTFAFAQSNPGLRISVKSSASPLPAAIVCTSAGFGGVMEVDKPICGEAILLSSKGNTVPPYPAGQVANPTTQAQGCDSVLNGAALKDKIVFVRRGTCEFGLKCLNASKSGAAAVIVINNAAGAGTIVMGPGTQGANVTVPCAMVSLEDGNAILAAMANGKVEMCFSVPSRQVLNAYGADAIQMPLTHRDTVFPRLAVFNATADTVKNVATSVSVKSPSGKVTKLTGTATIPPTATGFIEILGVGGYWPTEEGKYEMTYNSAFYATDTLKSEFVITKDIFATDNGGAPTGSQALAAASFLPGKIFNIYSMYTVQRNAKGTFATFGLGNYAAMKGRKFEVSVYEADDAAIVDIPATTISFGDLGELKGEVSEYTVLGTEANNSLISVKLKETPTKDGIPMTKGKTYIIAVGYDGTQVKDSLVPAYTAGKRFDIRSARDRDNSGTGIMTGASTFSGGFSGNQVMICRLQVENVPGVNTKDVTTLEASEVKIAPNPTNSVLNVTLDLKEAAKDVKVTITDMNGRVMQLLQVGAVQATNLPIEVANYAAGTYFLTVRTDKGVRYEKFVKVN
jgi:PA domain/Secretion system C-terminal sorting domain